MGKQLHLRLTAEAVGLTLAKFNHGDISAAEACVRLGVCKSRLYDLRAQWLRDRGEFKLGHSGGDNMPRWSDRAVEIAEKLVFASTENPAAGVNYALIADCIAQETGRRFDRTTVMRFCRKTWPLFCKTPRRRRPVRRWAMEAAGALWQIDSTPVHLFGPPEAVQHVVAIEDDATREIVAIGIFDSDSVLAEMAVFRMAVEARGVPTAIYTDGFTVFGHEGEDIKTAYGRMCAALSVNHLVAPSPQAKGKIERSMRTFQHRVAAIVTAAVAMKRISGLAEANEVVRRHVAFWNENHVVSTTKLTPSQALAKCREQGLVEYRPVPSATILDLFEARHVERSVVGGNRIRFNGREYKIAPTMRKKVWLVIRRDRFWVVEDDPLKNRCRWPAKLGSYKS